MARTIPCVKGIIIENITAIGQEIQSALNKAQIELGKLQMLRVESQKERKRA